MADALRYVKLSWVGSRWVKFGSVPFCFVMLWQLCYVLEWYAGLC